MNRKYTIEEYKDACKLIREYFDRPAITTDIIVGFPGETDEDFEDTYKNLTELNLYEMHVFKYSKRKGTVAEKLPDPKALSKEDRLYFMPSLYMEHPRYTIGLGDTFTAGVLSCFA